MYKPVVAAQGLFKPGVVATQVVRGAEAETWFVYPDGIASEEFGTPTLVLYISPTGIESGEEFGEPRLVQIVHPESIESGEEFGEPEVIVEIDYLLLDGDDYMLIDGEDRLILN